MNSFADNIKSTSKIKSPVMKKKTSKKIKTKVGFYVPDKKKPDLFDNSYSLDKI
jgi:hypothetical protein